MADFLDNLLTDPKRWLGLFMLLGSLSLMALLISWLVTRFFGVSATEIRLGPESSRVVFESVEKGTANREILVLVHPQGWQKTDIDIEPGNHLLFKAEGSVNIDLAGIIDDVQLRGKFENEVAAKYKLIRTPAEKRVPEDFFSAEQRQRLQLVRGWIDPDGFKNSSYASWPGRRERRILPDENAGGLLAALKTSSGEVPLKSETFFVGRTQRFVASARGTLWFTVNDVHSSDGGNPNLFFNDNVGLFWVKVRITGK